MIYGDEKIRDMARSILPSKYYRSARRCKKEFSKRKRQQVKEGLRKTLSNDNYEYPDNFDPNMDQVISNDRLERIVRNRRDGDKVNPIQRWFRLKVQQINSEDERYAYARSVLPNNLVGWHALTHLRWIIKDNKIPDYSRDKIDHWENLTARLENLLIHGGILELNKAIRKNHYNVRLKIGWTRNVREMGFLRKYFFTFYDPVYEETNVAPRLLKSIKDIPAFIEDLKKANDPSNEQPYVDFNGHIRKQKSKEYHPEWFSTTIDVLKSKSF